MVPLVVDPEALFAAGSAVVAAGDGVNANLTVLSGGFAAHTGIDVAGTVFGLGYQSAAESLLKAAASVINACRLSGAKIQVGASNYSLAEAASRLGGGGDVLPPPGQPVKVEPPGPPGTLGVGVPPPLLWAVIQSFVGDMWPDGDPAALHAAAGRWRGFGGALTGIQGALNGSKSIIGGQQIAEGEKVNRVLSQIGDSATKIGAQCGKLASTLDNFADEVSHAQNAIRDLLNRLGSMADFGHDVMLIFEGKALDELEQIANDIKEVLHNLGREAKAFEQSMKLGMEAIDGWVVDMEKDMRGEFKHFLGDAVGSYASMLFDTWANANEGAFKGLVGMVQGIDELDPLRFLYDPDGAAATWKGMTRTGLLNHLLNPQDAWDADKQMFRSVLHLDDWRADRPGLGAGENVFDLATLFLPGLGEAGAGAKGATAGARAVEEGGDAADAAGAAGRAGEVGDVAGELGAIGTTGSGLTKDLEGAAGDMPEIDGPAGGAPVTLPTDQLPQVPVESAPHPVDPAPAVGAHEPVSAPVDRTEVPTPTEATGPHEPPPAPPGAPHEPARASAGEPAPASVGEPPLGTSPPVSDLSSAGVVHEPVPAQSGMPHEAVSAPPAGPHDPAPPPENPHESVPAAAQAPQDPAAAPTGGTHETAPIPSGVPGATAAGAEPGGRLPSFIPRLADSDPARMPVSTGGAPAEPVPAAPPVPQQSPPVASSAPSPPAPDFTGPGGRPAELPTPRGGEPRGPSDGGLPGDHREVPPSDHAHGAENGGRPDHPPSGSIGEVAEHSAENPNDGGNHPRRPVAGIDYPLSAEQAIELLSDPDAEWTRLTEGGVPAHILDGYDPLAGRIPEEFTKEFTVHDDNGKTQWDWEGQAPNNGFAGEPEVTDRIPANVHLDRIGPNGGAFMSVEGEPLSHRGTPPGLASQYHTMSGSGDPVPPTWTVLHGPAKEAFGQPGGAEQWVVIDKLTGKPVPVKDLDYFGTITDLTP